MNYKKIITIIFVFTGISIADNISKRLDSLCTSLVGSLPDSVLSSRLAVIPFDDKTSNETNGLSVSEYIVVSL